MIIKDCLYNLDLNFILMKSLYFIFFIFNLTSVAQHKIEERDSNSF